MASKNPKQLIWMDGIEHCLPSQAKFLNHNKNIEYKRYS
jgi:hypothetical protein